MLLFIGCNSAKIITSENAEFSRNHKSFETEWVDKSRNRLIPVAFYMPKNKAELNNLPVVIFSHGYNQNHPGANKGYSSLNETLAQNGFFIASIQHELPTDELIPMTGNLQEVRLPWWERGCENIDFVIHQLKKKYPQLDYNHLIIMGHSNGGDMSTLYTKKHPEMVYKLITLDQRRVPFPRVKSPKIYSLRSSDSPSSEGVVPTDKEQQDLGITIIKLPNTNHNVMNDNGTEEQRKEINDYVLRFVKE